MRPGRPPTAASAVAVPAASAKRARSRGRHDSIAASAVPASAVSAVLAMTAASLWWIRRRYLVATVDGPSMEPGLRSGDRVLVRRTRRARTGQIVIVRITDPAPLDGLPPGLDPDEAAGLPERPDHPGWRLLVKRAAAVAGEPVPRSRVPALRDVPEKVVPPGSLVVLGDNPNSSWDSRDFGFVRGDEMVGVMVRRLPRNGG
ncbi:S26 family signal peptidase [Streptosporangium sp. NPDC023615]|uniref:S26 family signal peptidase n=1 Tax=Streptosporangium sp. NPDC023615 TaxID=3154794 RepID=UPI00344510E4